MTLAQEIEIEKEIMRDLGRQEGRQEGRLEDAKGMKAEGIPAETIIKITGISREEIEKL